MSETDLHRLCATSEVQASTPLRVRAPGYEALALCRLGDAVYAIADTCSHGMASLSEGEIADGQIFCPFHGGSFDILTGRPVERPCTIAIATYPLIERNGAIYIAARS